MKEFSPEEIDKIWEELNDLKNRLFFDDGSRTSLTGKLNLVVFEVESLKEEISELSARIREGNSAKWGALAAIVAALLTVMVPVINSKIPEPPSRSQSK